MISQGSWVRPHQLRSGSRCEIVTRERGERRLAELVAAGKRDWSLVPIGHCHVCGAPAASEFEFSRGAGSRCDRHADRNPCAVEGCKRSADAKGQALSSDAWICGEHWRRYVPPGSRARRAYLAHFRRARRHGWTDEAARRYWRLWHRIIAMVRRGSADGRIDTAALAGMFGWAEEA